MTRLLRALDRHFFAPASLRDLGVLRMTLAATQLLYLLLGLELVFGGVPGEVLYRQRLLAGAVADTYAPLPALKLLMLPFGWGARPTVAHVEIIWGLAVIAAVAATVGLFTRLSPFVLALTSTLVVAHGYSYGEIHHPEALLVIMLWVLAFAPASGWSIDRLLFRKRGVARSDEGSAAFATSDSSPLARWPMRVGQWLLVLSYLSAALSKLINGGADWLNGYTLTYYMLQDGTRYEVPLALWLASHRTIAQLMSVGALVFEATFALAVLVPRTAWAYVTAGILMHTTIFVTQRAPFFTFLAIYVVLLEPVQDSWRAFRAWLGPRSPSQKASDVQRVAA